MVDLAEHLFTVGAKVAIPFAEDYESGATGYAYIIAESDSRMALEEYHGTTRRRPDRHVIFDHDEMRFYEQTDTDTTPLNSTVGVRLTAPPWPSQYEQVPRGILSYVDSRDYEFVSKAFRTIPLSELNPPADWPDDFDPEPLPPAVQEENLETALYPPVDLSF